MLRIAPLVLVLAAACTPLGNPFEAATLPERVFAIGYENLVDRYIEPREAGELALAGLANLSTLDETVAISPAGNVVRVMVGGTLVAWREAPRGHDIDGWALLTANVVQDVRQASPSLRNMSNEKLYDAVFKGIFSGLDKYSRYLGPAAARRSRAAREGFGGLGVSISVKDGVAVITRVHRDTPAQRAGLKVGDRITIVDGDPIRGLSRAEVVERLRGAVNEVIAVTILRGTPPVAVDFSLVRAHIIVPTVNVRRYGNLLGIKITGFNQGTERSVRRALENAETEMGDDLKGLILDLRNNPGGLLDQAVEIADLFLDSGRIISTRGRHPDSDQIYDASSGAYEKGLPIAVLINGKSASAAEVLTAALRDPGRAAVLGSSSYGKGTVQTIIELPNGGEIIITWAHLHAPSGQTLHNQGVVPTLCTNGDGARLGRLRRALNAARAAAAQFPQDSIRPRSAGPHYSAAARDACPPSSVQPETDIEVARLLLDNSTAYAAAVRGIAPNIADRRNTGAGAALPGP